MFFLHSGKLRREHTRYKGLIVEEVKLFALKLDGSIIDLETSSLYPDDGEILTFGYIYNSTLRSITRTRDYPYNRFVSLIREEIRRLPGPYFAYNKTFEQTWLDYLGLPVAWYDVMKPLKTNAELLRNKLDFKVKWSKLYEAFPLRFLKYFGLAEYNVDNEDIYELWEEHQRTGSLEPLLKITQHNVLDLLAELNALLWSATLNRLRDKLESDDPLELLGELSFRCDVCRREVKDATELVYTQRVERRTDGSYRIVEMNVCKSCFDKIWKSCS